MDNYLNILKTPNMRVTEKAALLTEGLKKPSKNEAGISPFYISELLAGRSVALSNLFGDDRFKDAKKITLQNDLDANYNELCEVLDDHISVVTAAKMYTMPHAFRKLSVRTDTFAMPKLLYISKITLT